MTLDATLLARIQFGFTIAFHIVFPAFSIGLASFLAVLEFRWLRTKDEKFKDLYKFWVKIFAVVFGMGVVSGVVLSYEIGTNWSLFSDHVANVIGPLLGFEVLTAFFLEASFLGIMLFGWGRVGPKMHFMATVIVAIGTLISAFWILAANSWMQTPAGFMVGPDGRLFATDWLSVIFNPSFPFRFLHMVTAAYLTTAFVVGGVGALYLLRRKYESHARIMLSMATLMAALVAPMQVVIGDAHGLNTLKYQPAKVAAMEGLYQTAKSIPLILFGWPDTAHEKVDYAVEIPGASSLILTHNINGEVKGLDAFPKADRPPVVPVFFAFRVMVGIAMLMVAIGIVSAVQFYRKKLFSARWLHYWWVAMMPAGFIALLAGWFVTEIGRQPFVVYNVLRTAQMVTPSLVLPQVAWSLLCFVVLYTFIFGAASYYILKLISKGIAIKDTEEQYYQASREATAVRGAPAIGKPETTEETDV
jgi:cytochrome d ubiquinol oxidase subunit I